MAGVCRKEPKTVHKFDTICPRASGDFAGLALACAVQYSLASEAVVIKVGDTVKIKPQAYDLMFGQVVHICKVDGPWGKHTEDQNKWILTVQVPGDSRNSGLFQVSYTAVLK